MDQDQKCADIDSGRDFDPRSKVGVKNRVSWNNCFELLGLDILVD